MHARIVYESRYGNTAALAQAIAAGLREHGTVEVTAVAAAGEQPDPTVDLLVVGGPTHLFGMSGPRARGSGAHHADAADAAGLGIRDWLSAAGTPPPGTRAAVFGTRLAQPHHLPASAALAAGKHLLRLGYHLLDDPVEFLMDSWTGPVTPGELARARAWAERLGHTEADRIAHSSQR